MPTRISQSEKQRKAREQVLLADRIMALLRDPFRVTKEHLKDDLRETITACEDAPAQRRDIKTVASFRVRRQIIQRFKKELGVDEDTLRRAAGLCANQLLIEVLR